MHRSSPAGLELEQPSWHWLLRCSEKQGGVGVALQGTSVCWDPPFPLSHKCNFYFPFRTAYLWSEIYFSVDEQRKHPHNLKQKSLLPVILFTIRMTILRRELAIKASDGVRSPPTPPHGRRAPSFLSFRFSWIFLECKGWTLDSVIFNKQGDSNNHCDIFCSLSLCFSVSLSHSHTHSACTPLLQGLLHGKSRQTIQCWSSR